MDEEKKHHHLFHHNKDDEESFAAYPVEGTHDYKEDEKKHKKDEHLGEVGAVAAGLYAKVTMIIHLYMFITWLHPYSFVSLF